MTHVSRLKFSKTIMILLPICMAQTAAADPVRLESRDGSTTMTGEYLSFQDGLHHIETPLGDVMVSARLVVCIGAACPSDQDVADHMQKAGYGVMSVGPFSNDPTSNEAIFCPLTGAPLDPNQAS